MKKVISILLMVLMLFGAVGCTPASTELPPVSANKKDPAAFTKEVSWNVLESVTEDFPFEEYVADEKEKWNLGREAELDWWFQFYYHQCDKPFSEYDALATVVEITGIDATGRKPVGSDLEAVNLMMATGDFPDLITLDASHFLVRTLIEGGYVYSMDELIEMYEPGFADEIPEAVRTAGTYDDGVLWGMVGLVAPEWKYEGEEPYDLGNHAYNVRLDIWQELGCPSIATPDDLYNTLKLFKEKYPTMNGKESVGIVGYGTNADGTLLTMGYSFGLKQYISVNESTGVVTSRYEDPNYEEFILYMNKLYREGLLDPEFFVKDTQQQTSTLANNAFMMPYVWHTLDDANALLREENPDSVFVSIPPMSATGEEYAFAGSSLMKGESITLIPKTCSDPEAAMRLIRYAYSTAGSLQLLKGNPGEHYLVEDDTVYLTEKVKEGYSIDKNAYNKKYGIGDYYSLVYMPLKEDNNYDQYRLEYDIPNSYKYSYDSTIETYMMEPDSTSDAGIALSSIRSIGVRETAMAITASTEAEAKAIVATMQEEIKKVPGYDALVEYWTEQYAANMERFGGPKWGNP